MGNRGITLLGYAGHVDFSAEMERTLQVLDYAILVINGADGVQGHTMTLWRLLARYQIPTFLFINKMDQDGTDKEKLLAELKKRLSDNCVDFTWETQVEWKIVLTKQRRKQKMKYQSAFSVSGRCFCLR